MKKETKRLKRVRRKSMCSVLLKLVWFKSKCLLSSKEDEQDSRKGEESDTRLR